MRIRVSGAGHTRIYTYLHSNKYRSLQHERYEMQLTPPRLLLGKVVDSVVSDRYERVTFVSGGRREASLCLRLIVSLPFPLHPALLQNAEFISSALFLRRNLDARILLLLLFPRLSLVEMKKRDRERRNRG